MGKTQMPGFDKTLKEWKSGDLHSGSKHGPVVKSQKQAVAIGLSEQRKEGHQVKNHHEKTAPGHMGKVHDHHEEQTHAVKATKHAEKDGAGRGGHDMDYHSASEHKEPHHPAGSHTKQGHDPVRDGAYGYPGEVMRLNAGDKDHALVGGDYSQTMHEPAKLTNVKGPAGGIGMTAGMGKTPHGYGHKQGQKDGVHRLSGHSGAHRIGKR
jgi:hypothetical protein